MDSTESLLRNATHTSPGWIKLNCNAKGATEKFQWVADPFVLVIP